MSRTQPQCSSKPPVVTDTSSALSLPPPGDDLDWEEWDPSEISFVNHIIAGSIAGWAEHVALYPIDTMKTHVQYVKKESPIEAWKDIWRLCNKEGLIRLWRGVSAMFAGCVPAHAAYFSVFEASKKAFGADTSGHTPFRAALCGGLAAASHDLFMTPFDVVKQRMQLGFYKSISHCMRCIIRAEGVAGLYVSLPATFMMNIPYGLVLVPVNESMRKYLNPGGGFNFGASMMAGSVAGTVAAAVTTPLDLIKTRLQTQNLNCAEASRKMSRLNAMNLHHTSMHPAAKILRHGRRMMQSVAGSEVSSARSTFKFVVSRSSTHGPHMTDKTCSSCATGKLLAEDAYRKPLLGMRATARAILTEEGVKGFFRGVLPRMLVHAPSAAISWTTYESVKSFLVARNGQYY